MKTIANITVQSDDLKAVAAKSEFRKASRNMMFAYVAAEKALATIPEANKSRIAVVLSSCYGELAVTQEFLQTLCLSNMARPFLFQNSLHNATLGFLSLQLGLVGPSFTISNGGTSEFDGHELGKTLLSEGVCDYVLTLYVDTVVPGITPAITEDRATAVLHST